MSEQINIKPNPCKMCESTDIWLAENTTHGVTCLVCNNCGYSGGHVHTARLSKYAKDFTLGYVANLWNKGKSELVE